MGWDGGANYRWRWDVDIAFLPMNLHVWGLEKELVWTCSKVTIKDTLAKLTSY
jgi:hypothetical protein